MATTLNVSVGIQLENRQNYWAGWIEGVGTYVYADTVDGLIPRIGEVLDVLINSFDSERDMFAYMLKRGIQFQPEDDPPMRLAVSRELVVA